MRSQSAEHHRADHQCETGNNPEDTGHPPVFQEPHFEYEALAVPLDDVEGRVELEQEMIGRRKPFEIPEDRGEVESHLEGDGYQGAKILEEDHHRRGNPGDADQQDDGAEQVVENLNHVDVEAKPIDQKHCADKNKEKTVNYQCGNDLDDGEDADAEGDLLDDEGVLDDGIGTVVDAITDEKPGEHAADKPEDVGMASHRLGVETDLENEPEYPGQSQGEEKGPEDAQIGAQITGFEVTFGQFVDDVLAGEKFREEREKHLDALH